MSADQAELSIELLRDPPAAFRSVPFWSWNDELEEEELRRQIREMKQAGLGGFFMHARAGLRTPYMGERWMRCVEASLAEAREQGLEAWCYDENGWPSGAADGAVPAQGKDYQQQWLEPVWLDRTDAEGLRRLRQSPDLIALYPDLRDGALAVMRKYNPHYTDLLNEAAVASFIRLCHERYLKRFAERGGPMPAGIFTDEPQLARKGWPWSQALAELYREVYGCDITDELHALFDPACGEAERRRTRYRYWRLVSRRFARGAELIGEWCRGHGWSFTGHVMGENNLMSQMQCTGGAMPYYAHMSMPGIDLLGRSLELVTIPKQVSSVARQLGLPFVLTETFGCCGWNLSLEEMKGIAEWQFALGVNRLCPHLQAYSLKGERKRDYLPSLFGQQPWWSAYRAFNDYFARLTYLLSLGQAEADTVVIHPIRSAWLLYDGAAPAPELERISEEFLRLSRTLLSMQADHDYADEGILQAHGAVDGLRLRIGQMSYGTVVLPRLTGVDRGTLELLAAFAEQGGRVVVIGGLPEYVDGEKRSEDPALETLRRRSVMLDSGERAHLRPWVACAPLHAEEGDRPAEAPSLYVQRRRIGSLKLIYCVNTSKEERVVVSLAQLAASGASGAGLATVDLAQGSVRLAERAELERVEFAPFQSRLFMAAEDGAALPLSAAGEARGVALRADERPAEEETAAWLPNEDWELELDEPNALTLDYARYRIDGGAWSEPTYVLKIQEACIRQGKPVRLELAFEFRLDSRLTERDRQNCSLGVEDRDHWEISVNGRPLAGDSSGFHRDRAVRTYPIGPALSAGANEIAMSRVFRCSDEVYAYFDNAAVHEIVRNKLTYETEVEAIYVIGGFATRPRGGYERAPSSESVLWAEGGWELCPLPRSVRLEEATVGGLWFYAGGMRLTQTLEISDAERARIAGGERFVLSWRTGEVPAVRVWVNGAMADTVLWAPRISDITGLLRDGANRVTVELLTSCRNWLGPHHHVLGELHFVGPSSFTDRIGWVDRGLTEKWTDRYSFVTQGLQGFRGCWMKPKAKRIYDERMTLP